MLKLSVTSLLRYLKNKLDTDDNLQRIYVVGEISNYHRHNSGHLYFTLKDEASAISCVMFKSSAASLNFEPKTGDKVLVYANTSIFEVSGQLQFYVSKMSLDGLGDLYARYEQLKEKLSKQGKFDEDHKIDLPCTYLSKVAVLVGDNSAAMSDIKTCFERRWPLAKVDYYPVLVQGNNAPSDIIDNLLKVDKLDYEAIILARGGGSFEDLFCFNDENLVNTIYNLKTFIITGIGHEQDFTLADFVADLRAPTPTAAVELITVDINDVIETIKEYEDTIISSLNDIYDNKLMKYDYLIERLLHFQDQLSNISNNIDNDINRIKQAILHQIDIYKESIKYSNNTIRNNLNFSLNKKQLSFKRLNTLLKAYSSENVLKRGYSLVIQDDKIIKSKKSLKNKEFDIKFYDGNIKAIQKG